MKTPSLALSAAALVVVSLAASEARADVTSWLSAGAGYAMERNRAVGSNDFETAFTYSVGVGTTPLAPAVIGGLVRGTTFVGLGTDLGLAVRASTGGFARGDWGAAIEAGAIWRPWADGTYGEWPLQGVVTLGAPWGFQLSFGVQAGTLDGARSAVGGFATLEIDLLRLTVMRQGSTERWWKNPNPAGGHPTALLSW